MTPEAQFDLALQLLAAGRYAEGWPLYEARRRIERFSIPNLAHTPSWRGQDIAGKRLLVFGEQGFGDQIMFARFLPELARRGIEAIFYVFTPLATLFPGSVPATWKTWPPSDFYIPIGSLPWLLGATLDNLPPPAALGIPATGSSGIGVMVGGRPTHLRDAHRSLFGQDRDALLSLGTNLDPAATGAADFRDTARILAGLELVVTVDTAVAHLAASMGKPTRILLGAEHVDWRWGLGGEATPWYPAATLIRQQPGEPWSSVIGRVLT